jgi:S-adenosylmethionine:tRNA ribosyltransferase-isomerase
VYSLSDYDYELPAGRIAQQPAAERDRSRLLALDRVTGACTHHRFDALGELLSPGDLLVGNDTAVVPARLIGRKESGGRVEVLLADFAGGTRRGAAFRCRCLVKASKPVRAGQRFLFDGGLSGVVVAAGTGSHEVEFTAAEEIEAVLARVGHVPLPPYIRREDAPADRAGYQTVYARVPGAAAAPTAGLHFTARLLADLRARGIGWTTLTLHVGHGTFAPVRSRDIRGHRMHAERFELPTHAAEAVNRARAAGKRAVAVGTTAVRALESAAGEDGRVAPAAGTCDLFIIPGYRFKAVDGLITNFHLPRSTLLMLVCAFAGREPVLAAYREAVRSGYRFFSYGDAMIIL